MALASFINHIFFYILQMVISKYALILGLLFILVAAGCSTNKLADAGTPVEEASSQGILVEDSKVFYK
jgi:hypothetical protein